MAGLTEEQQLLTLLHAVSTAPTGGAQPARVPAPAPEDGGAEPAAGTAAGRPRDGCGTAAKPGEEESNSICKGGRDLKNMSECFTGTLPNYGDPRGIGEVSVRYG